jgi:hypothetical protein
MGSGSDGGEEAEEYEEDYEDEAENEEEEEGDAAVGPEMASNSFEEEVQDSCPSLLFDVRSALDRLGASRISMRTRSSELAQRMGNQRWPPE